MNRILSAITVFLIAVLFSSCASVSPNNKYFIGTWKPVKVEKHNIPNLNAQTGGNVQQAAKIEEKLNRLMESELSSTLTINKDKTAVKETRGRTVNGTWKLKKHGTRILVASKEKDKKITADILRMNDTSAVILENLPIGSLKVTMKKEKK